MADDHEVRKLVIRLTEELFTLESDRDRLANILDRSRSALGGLDAATVEAMVGQICDGGAEGLEVRMNMAEHLRRSIANTRAILAEVDSLDPKESK